MKNLFLTIMLLVPLTVMAEDDQSIMFEVGIGFGNASGGRTDGNDNAKFCKNRNTGRMMYGAVRYRYNNAEVHVARWMHDEEVANCDRDSWAIGGGYVLDTQGDGVEGRDDVYASWTPGFAYVWSDNKDFTGKDNDGTNWRQTSNWQTFNRFAVGVAADDAAAEVAVHRYGTFNPEHGEYFGTAAVAFRDLDDGNDDGDRGLTPPDEGGDTIINEGDTYVTNEITEVTNEITEVTNEITEVTNEGDTTVINITDNSTTVIPEGYVPPTIVEAPETGNVR